MKTKLQIIADIRAENPTIQTGDDDQGYTQITGDAYEAIILDWAEARYAKLKTIEDREADKAALLAKLGITADEAALLLG
jgi:hypothetical protein